MKKRMQVMALIVSTAVILAGIGLFDKEQFDEEQHRKLILFSLYHMDRVIKNILK